MVSDFLPPAQRVRRIGVLMLAEIGDLMVALPAVSALKRRYPQAHLTLLIRRHLCPLVARHPHVDAVMPYDGGSKWRSLAYCFKLRRAGFDLWVDLHTPTFNTVCSNDLIFRRNRLLMRASGARLRLGFAHPVIASALTHPVQLPEQRVLEEESVVDTTLRVVATVRDEGLRKRIDLNQEDQGWTDAWLAEQGVTGDCVGLFYGSKQSADVWPVGHVAAFIELLAQAAPGLRILLLGGPFERESGEAVRARLSAAADAQVVSAIGCTSLRQTAALLSRLPLLVTTDSGPMHMADALGVPMVTLFSSNNYLPLWLPVHSPFLVLNHRPACAPCLLQTCDKPRPCIGEISPEEALAAVLEMSRRVGLELRATASA